MQSESFRPRRIAWKPLGRRFPEVPRHESATLSPAAAPAPTARESSVEAETGAPMQKRKRSEHHPEKVTPSPLLMYVACTIIATVSSSSIHQMGSVDHVPTSERPHADRWLSRAVPTGYWRLPGTLPAFARIRKRKASNARVKRTELWS